MSKHRHHHHHKKARGGSMAGRDDYSGSGEPNVVKEAKEKKHGGTVHHHSMHGHKHHTRKKRGGSIGHNKKGADHNPFSSAYTASTEAK